LNIQVVSAAMPRRPAALPPRVLVGTRHREGDCNINAPFVLDSTRVLSISHVIRLASVRVMRKVGHLGLLLSVGYNLSRFSSSKAPQSSSDAFRCLATYSNKDRVLVSVLRTIAKVLAAAGSRSTGIFTAMCFL
jgi:hypothetical protein